MSETESGSVKAAVRTLDVLEAFADSREPMTLTEIADRIGVPLSSCHALIRTLQARGYVYQFDRRRWIYPTKRIYEIASAIVQHDPVLIRILPHLKALVDITRETVILGKRSGTEVIYLEVLEGPQTIRYSARAGERKPLFSSAAGKALLGQMTDKDLQKVLGRLTLKQMTPSTITDRDTLVADIRAGRDRGHYRTDGENVVDVMALAMPLSLAGEKFAVTVAGPAPRVRHRQDQLAKDLRATIQTLSEFGTDPDDGD